MRREVYRPESGGFDEHFQMYYEDLDLSWRARLAGYDIVYVPKSVVYHKYNLSLSGQKLFRVERNRYLVLMKHLRVQTLLLLLPALLLTELLVWVWAANSGMKSLRKKANSWMWLVSHRNSINETSRSVQALRERSDQELLADMDVGLPLDQLGVPKPIRPVLDPLIRLVYRPWHWLATR
jgi:Predicted glycosyltransferases